MLYNIKKDEIMHEENTLKRQSKMNLNLFMVIKYFHSTSLHSTDVCPLSGP